MGGCCRWVLSWQIYLIWYAHDVAPAASQGIMRGAVASLMNEGRQRGLQRAWTQQVGDGGGGQAQRGAY